MTASRYKTLRTTLLLRYYPLLPAPAPRRPSTQAQRQAASRSIRCLEHQKDGRRKARKKVDCLKVFDLSTPRYFLPLVKESMQQGLTNGLQKLNPVHCQVCDERCFVDKPHTAAAGSSTRVPFEARQDVRQGFPCGQPHGPRRSATRAPGPYSSRGNADCERMPFHACVSPERGVARVRGPRGQLGAHDVGEFVKRLPRTAGDIPVLVVRREGRRNSQRSLMHRQKVISALTCLQVNSPFYRDIDIDAAALDALQRRTVARSPRMRRA